VTEKTIEVAKRVKEKLDFYLQMEKEGFLYNWGGNEVVWLLEYLWSGGRFNDQKKHEWIEVLRDERDKYKQALESILSHREDFSLSRSIEWVRNLDIILEQLKEE